MAGVALVTPLKGTSHDTSLRRPCNTCSGVLNLTKEKLLISEDVTGMSNPGKVFRFVSN